MAPEKGRGWTGQIWQAWPEGLQGLTSGWFLSNKLKHCVVTPAQHFGKSASLWI